MPSPQNIRELLEQLNVDPERFNWQDLADCRNLELEWFFDAYEGVTARQVDNVCLLCPVVKECFNAGTAGKETGVWGGFFLDNGTPSKKKNKHKTQEVAKELAQKIYE